MAGFDNDVLYGSGLDVGTHPSTGSPDASIEKSTSGGEVKLQIVNSANIADSAATHEIQVAGTSAGDAWTQWTIGTANSASFGLDNSDSDKFKLTLAASGSVDPSSGTIIMTAEQSAQRVGFFTTTPSVNADFDISKSKVGGTVGLGVSNTDTTNVASHSTISSTVSGIGSGDPKITLGVGGGGSVFHVGVDNSDSDFFKIGLGGDVGTDTMQEITIVGEVTFPLTPAFLAQADGSQVNFATNASTTVEFPTEIFDQNGDYDNTTDTYTAPVSGRHALQTMLFIEDADVDSTLYNFYFVTSNRSYQFVSSPSNDLNADGYMGISLSILADMDAADTAFIRFQISNNGAAQADMNAGSYFSGKLDC
jgi:hypothetical protein